MMMSQELKSESGSISATIHCDGPLGGLTAVCTPDAQVRGYVNFPVVETRYKSPGKLDVGGSVGKGNLTVIRDSGHGTPYIGQVELVSGEIAEDLAAYFFISEQIPSVVSLGVKMSREGITHAGGLIVQLLPEAGCDITDYIEKRALGFPEITWLFDEGFTPEEIIDLFFGDPDLEYYEPHECGYQCSCSEERMIRNLLAIGKDELDNLAMDEAGITLECHFCNMKYHFDQKQVQDFTQQAMRKTPPEPCQNR
jgi:molecular chaperone Hsp33